MVGKTIGKYRFVAPVGRGGMGTVYRAVDETLDREVAIKVLSPDLAHSEILQRFRAEAMALAKLNHRDIATIYELCRSDSDLLMVMEFVRGESLDRVVERSPQLSIEHSVSIVDRLLSALDHAHRAGIVHRDLKPANIMITDSGGVKIMDFGIARVVGTDQGTKDGFLIGTPSYMSPEQVLGHEVDGRSDLYSVGVMFYRFLTGTLPFTGETIVAIAQKQVLDIPPPLHLFRHGLPDWCETIVQRALAKSPAMRFQNAEEFRAALASAAGTLTAGDLHASPGPVLSTASAADAEDDARALAVASGATILLHDHPSARSALLTPAAIALSLLAVGDVQFAMPWPHVSSTTKSLQASAVFGSTAPPETEPATRPVVTPVVTKARLTAGVTRPKDLATSITAQEKSTSATVSLNNTSRANRAAEASHLAPVVFDVTTIVGDGEEQRARKGQALLANGTFMVIAADRTVLQTLEYGQLDSISYSRGRNPLWKSPSGPIPIARVKKSKFGFFTGDRHWISLRAGGAFVVLRVEQGQASKLLDTLEKRTGRSTVYILDD
jgi:serine/threonine protein kinase